MENNKKAEIKTDLHAMNKMLMAQLPELEEKRKNELSKEIRNLALAEDGAFKYLMLLSNERKDYTVFALRNKNRLELADTLAKEVMECLENRGQIKEFDVKKDANAIEIWIDDAFYALFVFLIAKWIIYNLTMQGEPKVGIVVVDKLQARGVLDVVGGNREGALLVVAHHR